MSTTLNIDEITDLKKGTKIVAVQDREIFVGDYECMTLSPNQQHLYVVITTPSVTYSIPVESSDIYHYSAELVNEIELENNLMLV